MGTQHRGIAATLVLLAAVLASGCLQGTQINTGDSAASASSNSGSSAGSSVSFDFRCITDYDCAASDGYRCAAGRCVECKDDNDCAVIGLLTPSQSSGTYCDQGTCTVYCRNDADCIGNSAGPSCLTFSDGGLGSCQEDYCHSNADCAANFYGHFCDLDAGGAGNEPGTCGCHQESDCPADNVCMPIIGGEPFCQMPGCQADSDCSNGQRCFPQGECRDSCGDGGACGAATPVCDTGNASGLDGQTYQGADPSAVWCYQCITSADCAQGQGCYMSSKNGWFGFCGTCFDDTQCANGPCVNGTCLSPCDDGGSCGPGMVCDTANAARNGAGLCYQCLSPIDCPNGEGCNSETHLCGSCSGPRVHGGSNDCPPGSVCSDYWGSDNGPGVCLQQCDAQSCPANRPLCAVFQSLSQEQAFCFGCLSDADCAGSPPGSWCDTSIDLSFTCEPPVGG